MDSILREAAASAQAHLYGDEEFYPPTSVEFQTNHAEGNVDSFAPLNLLQDSFSSQLSNLPAHYRHVFENLQHKIGYQVNYFAPESGSKYNEVKLVCKICCETVDVEKTEAHILDQKHLRNLADRHSSNASATTVSKATMCNVKAGGAKKGGSNATPTVPLSSAQTELNKLIASTESLYSRGRKVAQDLTNELKNYANYFEFQEIEENRSCFTCKMCRMSIPTKNARLHIYSDVHLRSLRRSLSVAKLPALNARNKTLVKSLISQFYDKLFFFQLISDNELNELYFICKVCAVVLVPECFKSHIDWAEHSKNLQENPVVLNFDSLNNHNKLIVRELHAAVKVSRIKDFSFVYRIGTEELWFYCKCCQITLIPEKVKDHVNSGEHSRAAKVEWNSKRHKSEDDIVINAKVSNKTSLHSLQVTPSPTESQWQNFTAECHSSNPTTVSRNSFQTYESKNVLDSKGVNDKTAKYSNLVLPVGIISPYGRPGVPEVAPNFNFKSVESAIKNDLREHSNDTCLRSDLNIVTASNGKLRFVCQDCSSVIYLKASKANLVNQDLIEKLFTNCCGKSAETVLHTARNWKVPDSNSLDYGTTPLTTKSYDFESAGYHSSSPTTSSTNFSESALSAFNDPNKEILKTLIDKIGIKVSDFDFFQTNLNELRFKCKFCGVIMRPETVEDHMKGESHLKYSQLSNLPNLAFESLNDSSKKFVRKLFNKIGSQINDFNAVVTLGFACKICGIYVKAKTLEEHMRSEEHFKCLSGRGSYYDAATGSTNALINAETVMQDTSSYGNAHDSDTTDIGCCRCIIL